MKTLKILLLLSLFLFMMSCGKDKNTTDFLFNINALQLDGTSKFIVLSNQNGDILYQSTDLNGENVKIEKEDGDVIDLTYGWETQNSARIKTYRDVESNFDLSTSQFCLERFVLVDNSFSNFMQDVSIVISGVPEYEKLLFDGQIKTEGAIISLETRKDGYDRVISILPKNESTYLSYKIRNDDLIELDDEIILNLDFSFFKPSFAHVIEMSESDLWFVSNISYLTSDDKLVKLGLFSDNGNNISIITVKDESITDFILTVQGVEYSFFNSFTEIPSTIELFDFNLAIDGSIDHFDFASEKEYDLAKVSYSHFENNLFSKWDIFQRKETSKSFTLPKIPSNLLKDSPILKTAIKSFDSPVLECINVKDNQKIFTRNLYSGLGCLEYVSQTIQ